MSDASKKIKKRKKRLDTGRKKFRLIAQERKEQQLYMAESMEFDDKNKSKK